MSLGSFGTALSGLSAAQANLNTTANNIANANTVGFKESSVNFGDIYQSSLYGTNGTQSGTGVTVTRLAQDFSQGTIASSNSSLDMALNNGAGFFTMSNNGSLSYTRAGSFTTDNSGYVVNGTGERLQVFAALPNGGFNTGGLSDLQLTTADNPPAATSSVDVELNLPSGATAPTTATFSPTDATSYNQTTSVTVYDSLGAAHSANLYFVAGATANDWTMYTSIDGVAQAGSTALQYSSNGALITPAGGNVTLPGFTPGNGASAMNMSLDLSKTTQFGSQFAVSALNQDGYSTGKLTGIAVDSTGVVQARYSNGQSKALGQIALTTFANPQGLQQLGNASWAETFGSGQALRGVAGATNFGQVQSKALESSNVDLTTQLVNMITAQRSYQANAQMIQTADQITQTIINIR